MPHKTAGERFEAAAKAELQAQAVAELAAPLIAEAVAKAMEPKMGRNEAYARLSEVPFLTPSQRVAIVNAMTDTLPADLPPNFRSGVKKSDLETAEIEVPDVPRYHDGMAAQVGDVVRLLHPQSELQVVLEVDGKYMRLQSEDGVFAPHVFQLVQRSPLDFPDGPEHDYGTEDALWEQGQVDAERCDCNNAEPHVEFVSIDSGAPPEGCEECGIPPEDDRDGTFAEGDWLYEATFLVALHALLMTRDSHKSLDETIEYAKRVAEKALGAMP